MVEFLKGAAAAEEDGRSLSHVAMESQLAVLSSLGSMLEHVDCATKLAHSPLCGKDDSGLVCVLHASLFTVHAHRGTGDHVRLVRSEMPPCCKLSASSGSVRSTARYLCVSFSRST